MADRSRPSQVRRAAEAAAYRPAAAADGWGAGAAQVAGRYRQPRGWRGAGGQEAAGGGCGGDQATIGGACAVQS